jgi:2-oxoisovalerate dehydrogenase E2 component (dihydrolipoyl transacylase)
VITVTMPQLGEGQAEASIGRWIRRTGEHIAAGDPLVEIVTDKVNVDVPSPETGVLVSVLVAEGTVVAVGTPIAEIESAGLGDLPIPTPVGTAPTSPLEPAGLDVPSSSGSVRTAPTSPLEPLAPPVRAAPAVRRLADELGVDLARVATSDGRVTRQDVLSRASPASMPGQPLDVAPVPAPAAGTRPISPGQTPTGPAPVGPISPGPDDELVLFSRMRQGIAAQMTRSLQVPHAYITFEIDMTAVARRRAALRAEYLEREGMSLGVVPFVVKAVAESLRRHPDLNAHWTSEGLVRKRHLNIGIAVAVDDGLLVPVIHDADQLSLSGLNHAVSDLAARARERRLRVPDLQGGTFTVDNAGWFGSLLTQPILNIPEIVIVTMDAIVRRPVVRETPEGDTIAIRSLMNMCAGFDHRATDGAQVGRFLRDVREWLESVDERTPIW